MTSSSRRTLTRCLQDPPTSVLQTNMTNFVPVGNELYNPIWHGSQFVHFKKSNWIFLSTVFDSTFISDGVLLSGMILQPATYLCSRTDFNKPILLEADKLFGVVRVFNYAYEKLVNVRASLDNWLSYIDQPAKYHFWTDTATSPLDLRYRTLRRNLNSPSTTDGETRKELSPLVIIIVVINTLCSEVEIQAPHAQQTDRHQSPNVKKPEIPTNFEFAWHRISLG
ncbi:hypothetical protein P879_00755 [Paragonimus westermani]|uniref:CBM21 domain-containing protein n=1 Tax=Paragonimus westermani TaxID=34504 RepID=A0A8T0DSD5_9TREM|nr:hypothetical protein P879_00755 [Paragonimus westermani]